MKINIIYLIICINFLNNSYSCKEFIQKLFCCFKKKQEVFDLGELPEASFSIFRESQSKESKINDDILESFLHKELNNESEKKFNLIELSQDSNKNPISLSEEEIKTLSFLIKAIK